MTKTVAILLGSVLIASIVAVTVLVIMGRSEESLIQFLATIIIPTVVSAYAAHKAEQAAHNTNGRMSELIGTIREQGKDVPEGYEDVDDEADTSDDTPKSPKVDKGVPRHLS